MADGDPDALATIYDRHSGAVFGVVTRVLQDQSEAADVTQEVFAEAWTQAKRYDAARGPVASWLLLIARRRAIDRLRSRHPTSAAAPDGRGPTVFDLPDSALAVEHGTPAAQSAARLAAALTALPTGQREAIELAYFEGLSQTQIAERLDQPVGAIKTSVRAGLLALREALTA